MSLYLKYRPRTFDDVVGQNHIMDILRAQMNAWKFSHNYLFCGPRGTGKTSTARLLAKAANLTSWDFVSDPAARLIDMGQTLDFVEIDAASHTGVDNIREEIIDKALYPPTHLKKKVYVIDEVHMLSKGAFNALLKIMEEPPAYLLFILATTEINKVPDTIISRCQVFNFTRVTVDDIVWRLAFIAAQEGIEYDDEWLRLIAKLSSGAMRDAIKYLEQISMLGKVSADNVTTFLGAVSEAVLHEFIGLVKQGQPEPVFTYLDGLVDNGVDLISFAKDIMLWLDEHFMDDVQFSVGLAQACKDILVWSKGYPYPLIIYKTVLWKYLTGEHAPREGSSPAVTPTSPKSSKPTSPKAKEVHAQTVPPVTPPVASPNKADAQPMSYDTLMQELIARVEGTMLKSILKKNVIIDVLENDMLSLIIINEQFYSTVQKPEITTSIEKTVSDIIGKPTTIKRTYMSKEDWLHRALV